MHRLQELVRLHRMGTGRRERCRLLKMGPNTERTYREAVEQAGMLEGPVQVLPPLEVLKEIVTEYVQSKPLVQLLERKKALTGANAYAIIYACTKLDSLPESRKT